MEQQSLRTDDCTEKVIRYYSDMVYRLAFARTGTKHYADDVFQGVFAVKNVGGFINAVLC